jgi:hypothetical protein
VDAEVHLMAVLPNPNRAVLAVEVDFTQGPPNVPGGSRKSIDTPINRVAVREIGIDRGRVYELDQSAAGVATLKVYDPLEYLNPQNTSSPYNTAPNQLQAYRCMSISAFWPTTGNLYNSSVNATFDPSFESGISNFTAGGGTTLASSTTHVFAGSKALLVTQGGNTSAAWPAAVIEGVPGMTVTVSVYAYLTGGAHLQIQCPDGTNSSILTTQTAFTRITVTYTVQECRDKIVFAGTSVATPTYWLDAMQVEWASSASTFATTGPVRYPLYTGYMERWPMAYGDYGNLGMSSAQAVDAIAILSRMGISQSYATTIAADSPLLYAPLNNTVSLNTGSIGTGFLGAVPLELANSTNGSFQWAGDTFPDGDQALVINQRNANNPPTTVTLVGNVTDFQIVNQPVSLSTTGATVEIWCKYTSGVIKIADLTESWTFVTEADTGSAVNVQTWAGNLQFQLVDPATSTSMLVPVSTVNPAVSGFPDNGWHYYAYTYNTNGTHWTLTVDDVEATSTIALGVKNIGYQIIEFLTSTANGDPLCQQSLGRLGIYNRDIGTAARLAHFNRGNCYQGEFSGSRVSRLLTAFWGGTINVSPGYLRMASDGSYNTRTVLDVLQEIQDSEHGLLYAGRTGAIVFEDRTYRYGTQTASVAFGENPSGASPTEYPYSAFATDFDPTYVFTQANLGRPGNSSFAPMVNATSKALYGQRILTETIQCLTDFDLTQAGTFYLARYSGPKVRITTLTLDLASQPALWPVALALEISQRVTVHRRTGGLSTSSDYYIEKISHKIQTENGSWTVDLQLSPVFVPSAWVCGDSTYGVLGTTTVPVY